MTGNPPAPDGSRRIAARRRWALGVAGAAALLSIGGLVGATFIQSPEQQRASAGTPERSVLTAPVERRLLASTVVARGTVTAQRQVDATPAAGQGGSVAVLTAIRTRAGATVKAGDVVLAVSGRPLLAMPGAVPAYRDMRPGDSGNDIAQLQQALRSLGHYRSGDRKGYFGPATKTAVRRLYGRAGFQVPDTANAGGAGSGGANSEKQALRAAQDAVTSAARDLRALQSGGGRPAAAAGPGAGSRSDQLADARKALARAREDLADLVASTGPMMPLAEVVFLPAFPATVVRLGAKVGDPVQAPLITFSTGRLAVLAKLQPEQASLLREGMRVSIVSESLGERGGGVVSTVGALSTDGGDQSGPGGNQGGQGNDQGNDQGNGQTGGAGPYVPVTVLPNPALGGKWNGLDVRLTITAAQTSGEVLVVPLSAVSAAADGRTTVTVGRGDTQRRVEVRPGVSGDGFVEVTPVAGELKAGDLVVVGR